MLINHTEQLKENNQIIDDYVGPTISIFDIILMGGTGSEKMQISACSTYFKEALNNFQEINYGNIEIRTKGILVHLNNGRLYHVWCVPFYRLAIYQTDKLSIHGEGQVIKFHLKKNQNKSFIKKLLRHKASFNTDHFPS